MISLSSETSVERSNSSSLDVHDDIIHPFLIYLKSLSVIDLFPVAQINIVRITLNANPCAFNGDEKEPSKMHSARLKALTQKIGQYIPSNITQNDMTASKFPSFLLGCLKHAVSDIYPCLSPYQKNF